MKIEAGTILIATDPCVLTPSGKHALIVGKEYVVDYTDEFRLTLLSEGNVTHHFYLDDSESGYYGKYFKIKEPDSELSETEQLQLQLESAQQQAYTALVNAFSTIEAFAVPSYTPLYEGYDKFRKYLLEMYNPNK